ncbi:MAG TPA: tetratricopeptide repeat protein, partial [Bacteroidia bacterium]
MALSQVCSGYEKIKLSLDRNLESKNNDSALYFINKIPKQEGICELEYLTHKIKYYFNVTNYDSAFVLLKELDQKLAKNPVIKNKIQLQHLYGQYYYYSSLTDSASWYFLKTLELSEQHADTTMQIRALSSLGNTFANLKQFDKALEYANKALALCITTKNKKTEIYLLGNIMTFYGRYYTKTHNASYLDSAETCSKRLIAEAKKHNKKYELLKAYSVLGSCYFSAKKFDLTLLYSDSILLVADREMHLRPITQAYGNICDSYLELGLNKKAKPAADSALVYALKLNDVSTIADSYYRLYDCENMLGNYRNALMYFQKYSSLNDSLKSEDQIQTVNELEQKYSKAKNEK